MIATFDVTVTESKNCHGIWLNTITLKLQDGTCVLLDRDETLYDGENGMEWRGLYIWDGETENHDFDPEIFRNAVVESYEIEDDVEEGYDIVIRSMYIEDIEIKIA